MYQRFYGFTAMPFADPPDDSAPSSLFLSSTHHEALHHLKYGVAERKGFIVLIGPAGSGKTALSHRFLAELDRSRFDSALILNPKVTETQMLKSILAELGETKLARSQVDLVAQMNKVLLERIQQGRDIVLIIDGAHELKFDVLEQIRLLSNLETDQQKLLQTVLIGRPELREVLSRQELRQLRQRILVHYQLKPLSLVDLEGYIQHRLSLVGGTGRPRFTRWALRAIRRSSQGVIAGINRICDGALLAAFIRNSDEVTYWDVRRANRPTLPVTS